MRWRAALAAAGLLLAAAAPSPAPPDDVDPARLEAAQALMTTMHAQETATAMLHNLRGVIVHSIQARTSQGEEQVGKLVDEVLMPEVESRVGELMDLLARVQAQYYTLDDLQQLRAFYQTPLGQKVIEVTPEIGASSFAIGQEWGQTVASEAIRKHAEELRQRGVRL